MLYRALLLFLLLAFAPLNANPILPELNPKKVTQKTKEIMKAHVTYKEYSPELSKRILSSFLDELDPSKTYLIKSDIDQWLNPSAALQQQVIIAFQKSQFSVFEEIYKQMVKAVERRRKLEAKVAEAIKNNSLPKDVDTDEFKKIEWAANEEELLTRLLKIRALQQEATKKLDDDEESDAKEQAEQRIEKRRKTFEDNFIGITAENKQKFILSKILKAFASSLDSHTNYLTPAEASQFVIDVQRRLFGIGAQLRDDINGLTVVKIVEGGPAEQGKELLAKDKIIAVNGVSVIGMDITEAVELIRGPKKSEARLSIIRKVDGPNGKEEQKKEIVITRGEVIQKDARIESSIEPFGDGVIAHLRLFSFYQDPESSSAKDLTAALNKIQKDYKVKGVILDLRSNSGGLIVQAVAVTGLFITKGIVCSIMDPDGDIQNLRVTDPAQLWDGPLIVLTNRLSASASEIVAQALQDYGRAIIVGDEHSFGKGTFQDFTLSDIENGSVNPEGEFKVTRGRYYTVSGKSPQLVGVQSDIVVPSFLSFSDIGEEFEKYPLANDKIAENYKDNLSDIPWSKREQARSVYRFNLQPRLTKYYDHLGSLKKNSSLRIEESKSYQAFLKELQKKKKDRDIDDEPNNLTQVDLQYLESLNIMRDLILFQLEDSKKEESKEKEKPAKAA